MTKKEQKRLNELYDIGLKNYFSTLSVDVDIVYYMSEKEKREY